MLSFFLSFLIVFPIHVTSRMTEQLACPASSGEYLHGVRFLLTTQKNRPIYAPHKSQEECVPRGLSKVSHYFEVDETIVGLGYTQSCGTRVPSNVAGLLGLEGADRGFSSASIPEAPCCRGSAAPWQNLRQPPVVPGTTGDWQGLCLHVGLRSRWGRESLPNSISTNINH